MHARADDFAALVCDRADVDVLAEAAALDDLGADVGQFIDGEREVDVHDVGGHLDALEVLARTEEQDLAALVAPVPADALEDAGAVEEGVRHHRYAGFLERDDALLEVRVGGGHGLWVLSFGSCRL